MAKTSSSGGWGKVVLGFFLGIISIFLFGFLYLKFGNPPVAVTDTPFPFEKQIVHIPLNARIDSQMKKPPFGTSEDVYVAGAHVYRDQCAICHGTPGHNAEYGTHMYPSVPQLWRKHRTGNVVGVSDDEPGETYWKVANGIRLTGMPAFDHILNDTEMWQVTLLLKNADTELPQPVMQILTAPSR